MECGHWGSGVSSPLQFYIERRALVGCYNSNHGTRLERVGGGGMWSLGYKSSFFMFGE